MLCLGFGIVKGLGLGLRVWGFGLLRVGLKCFGIHGFWGGLGDVGFGGVGGLGFGCKV